MGVGGRSQAVLLKASLQTPVLVSGLLPTDPQSPAKGTCTTPSLNRPPQECPQLEGSFTGQAGPLSSLEKRQGTQKQRDMEEEISHTRNPPSPRQFIDGYSFLTHF